MSMNHGGVRQRVISVLTAAFVVAALITVPAPPAAAGVYKYLQPTTWAYTDSRTPLKSYVNTTADAPVGAWLDDRGRRHRSRSYFSFDISSYRGTRLMSATFSVRETEVNDCSATRTWELWRTDRIRPTTSWLNPPRAREKVADIGGEGCGSYVGADLTEAVRAALARNETTLTVELRVPGRLEGNVRFGRRVEPDPAVYTEYNTPPGAPTGLKIDGKSCSDSGELFIANTTPYLNATLTDPDAASGGGSSVYGKFAIWPVDRPAERVETPESWAGYAPTTAWGYTPAGLLQNGVTYALAARSRDQDDVSPWSAECRFTVDTVRPSHAPTVTSTDYPDDGGSHGGPGIAGAFTFSANGDPDVVGYRYGFWSPSEFVAAETPGGSVTVDITPTSPWSQYLYVQSVDRAGNVSESAAYEFNVRQTAPSIEDTNRDAWLGDPRTLVFRPGMENTVSYTYQLDDDAEQTIPAGTDGTARITVTPAADGTTVHLFSTNAAGQRSQQTWIQLTPRTAPVVETTDFRNGPDSVPVGTPGTFTLKPHMYGVVEYVYQFDWYDGTPLQTVAAGPDGTATVQFTAADIGQHSLRVFTRTAAGVESDPTEIAFNASSIAPRITSAEYPEWNTRGGPGIEGTFTLTPTAADVVEYEYQFSRQPVRTVAAGAPTTIRWTPLDYNTDTYDGSVMLQVRSRSANGLVSDWYYYRFWINALAPTATHDKEWPETAHVGEPVTFTFTAQLPGSTEFLYTIGDGPEEVVAVGPNGITTVQWTPTGSNFYHVNVYSRTAAGAKSGRGHTSISVQE
ncbi:hypothetical protein [Virgisporangium aurantiacum]|uniref:Uncharacterized protein n=1 Tax=Virgisporangium aurantiacum TaxID=175570 RepID=A0A8J3ZAH2_9ACTN|nr:hypothetical protein [Virgisporangium aurantiacum]GIJ57743.1 hypothetical protein Vau01_052590 [Virgisporangium aurantiacum]